MTNSDGAYGTAGIGDHEVLGVLTGRVPVRSMPIAVSEHDEDEDSGSV